MAEPKIGMKFSSYHEVLKNAQKHKQVQSLEFNNKDGRFVTNIKLTTGSLYMDEPGQYSNESITNVVYNTDSFHYSGSGRSGQYTPFSEIHGTNTYARDLNGNGIVDKGEIFKH